METIKGSVTMATRLLLWMTVLAASVVNTSGEPESQYHLASLTNYTLFSGPIEVSYTIPMNASLPEVQLIQLVSLKDESVITYVKTVAGYNTGVMTIMCGTLDYAGRYVFRLREREDSPVLTESAVMYAVWPPATVTLPQRHIALTTGVTVTVDVAETACESGHGNSRYSIEVVYYGSNESYFGGRPEPKQYVYQEEVSQLRYLQGVHKLLTCDHLDQGGVYQGRLQSSHDEDRSIATSQLMFVDWSPEYSLTAERKSVFPCTRTFEVRYSQPVCTGNKDKIRMYEQRRTNASLASPIELIYRAETRARQRSTITTFPCSKFSTDAYGYCFKYVSTAKSGAIFEQKAICVPTTDIPALTVVDGGWGSWSPWGQCSETCGVGKRTRYRVCDSPAPSRGGMYCVGDNLQSSDCDAPCVLSSTPSPQFTPDPSCPCGCEILRPAGQIVSSSYCQGSVIWTIRAYDNRHIRLSFDRFSLLKENKNTWIKIRNGDSLGSELLLYRHGGHTPSDVVATRSAMLIEFFLPHERDMFGRNEGFVASFKSYTDNSTLVAAPGRPGGSSSVWGSTITVVGICLCGVIIIATVAVVCHHRRMKTQRKLLKAQASQALLGNAPHSPTHSHHSLAGSANVSYTDMMASTAKREYVKAKGSPSKALAQRHKHAPPSGGRQVGSRRSSGSRKGSMTPGSLHQSPLPSPYAANASLGDYSHDPGMFQADEARRHHDDQASRRHHKHRSPPVTPTKRSPTKRSPTKPRVGAPMADFEDLSPSSPTHRLYSPHKSKMAPINEDIPLDSYAKRRHKNRGPTDDSNMLKERPPVEGRDSLTRKNKSEKPTSLPLRDVQRPDGQSPENKPFDPPVHSPTSHASDMSPALLKHNPLFPDSRGGSRTPSEMGFVGEPDFEFDDYIPDLPGSYFTMDPHAYTLTWSQQAPWGGGGPGPAKSVSHAGSMASIRTNDNTDRHTSQC